MKHSGSSINWLWLSQTLMPLLLIAFLLPLTPQDYWWYLRLGQDILQSGSVPTVDAYSYTQAGMPFFYQSWLAAVLYWKIYQSGGVLLTFFVRGMIIALTYTFVWFTARETGAGPKLASLLTLLAALSGTINWAFRPQLFAYPLFVIALFVVQKWTHGEYKGLWVLPILALFWVNIHGSFPLLFILVIFAVILGSGDRKRLLVVSGISILAILINPHGVKTFGYVQNMLSSQSNQFSVEWAPIINRGWQANLFFLWLLIFALFVSLSSRKLSSLDWAYFLSFGWLALSGMRYVIWFLFILVMLTASLISGMETFFPKRATERENKKLNGFITGFLLLLPLIALPGIRDLWWTSAPYTYADANPVNATKWLDEHPELDGPLFSNYSHSSYLIFALPSRPVWIDPRFELYPPEQWRKYSEIVFASTRWQALLDDEGVNLVMLSPRDEPGLINAMREAAEWCQVYKDEAALIFHRGNQCQ